MRDLLWGILSGAGHKVVLAETGLEVIGILEKTSDIDLVLLDVNMPELSGIDALKQMKAIRPNRPLKVCFVSGSRDKETVLKSLGSGGSDYIVKPIDPVVLLERVHGLLGGQNDENSFPALKIRARCSLKSGSKTLAGTIISISEVGLELELDSTFDKSSMLDLTSLSLSRAAGTEIQLSCKVDGASKVADVYQIKCSLIATHESVRRSIRLLVSRRVKIDDGLSKAG